MIESDSAGTQRREERQDDSADQEQRSDKGPEQDDQDDGNDEQNQRNDDVAIAKVCLVDVVGDGRRSAHACVGSWNPCEVLAQFTDEDFGFVRIGRSGQGREQ